MAQMKRSPWPSVLLVVALTVCTSLSKAVSLQEGRLPDTSSNRQTYSRDSGTSSRETHPRDGEGDGAAAGRDNWDPRDPAGWDGDGVDSSTAFKSNPTWRVDRFDPLDPIDDCPARCKCYYRPYRGAGTPDPLLTVNCTGLALVEFPDILPQRTQVLDMSANGVMNLTSLPRLPDLRVLDVSRNWLRYVDNRWLFEHVSQLRVLRMADNGLRELQHGTFLGLTRLLELDVSGNRLQRAELHAFADLRRLQVFRMDGNDLFHVKRSWFLATPSLVELRLAGNGLSKLGAGMLQLLRLQHLDLSDNRLRRLDPGALTGVEGLRMLNLSGNYLMTEVPSEALKVLPGLDILLLDGLGPVRLSSYVVTGLSAVELSLSYLPELRSVGRAAFHNLARLRTLQLHDCPRLAFLHPEAFQGVPELRRLLVHNNALVALSSRVAASLPSLGDLHVYHNPLRCDCNVYWLRRELSDYSRRYYTWLDPGTSNGEDADDHYSSLAFANTSSIHSNPPSSQLSTSTSSLSSSTMSTNKDETSSITDSKSIPTPITTNSIASAGSKPSEHHPAPLPPSIISEPGRVSCFFPDGASSLPLVQQPLQYFPAECPPVAMPFFPSTVNVSLGEPLDLECHGLGVPEPVISWVLPGGMEMDASSSTSRAIHVRETEGAGSIGPASALPSPSKWTGSRALAAESQSGENNNDSTRLHEGGVGGRRAEIRDATTLHLPAARLRDSGTYRCRARSVQGQDISAVLVRVLPQPLALTEVKVSSNYVMVAWEGSIPRSQLQDFQIYYREMPTDVYRADSESKSSLEKDDRGFHKPAGDRGNGEEEEEDIDADKYNVVNLHYARHTCRITDLQPATRYELCMVYRGAHRMQCRLLITTASDAATVVRTSAGGPGRGGIAVHVTKAQIGAGIGAALGGLVLIWAALVVRRLRRRGRKEYQSYRDPLREEKASIPLEGLAASTPATGIAAPSTPLTSSRTALLTHSQI